MQHVLPLNDRLMHVKMALKAQNSIQALLLTHILLSLGKNQRCEISCFKSLLTEVQ